MQQAMVPSIPPRACATLTPHISIINAALNASNAKAEQLKHQIGIESASALVSRFVGLAPCLNTTLASTCYRLSHAATTQHVVPKLCSCW